MDLKIKELASETKRGLQPTLNSYIWDQDAAQILPLDKLEGSSLLEERIVVSV